MSPRTLLVVAVVVTLVAGACTTGEISSGSLLRARPRSTTTTSAPAPAPVPVRDISVYEGLGAWIDVFDYVPAYQDPGEVPSVTPDDVAELVDRDVETLYLQATRLDPRSPDGIADDDLMGQILVRARTAGIRVVGWYLPKFADLEVDMRRVEQIRDFEYRGHRFDGVALDIEWRGDVPDHAERNDRLVELSRRLRERMGTEALGAIVPPPVLLEVINTDNWPDFPWRELSDLYDVWLPMSYWTLRASSSGYRDGYVYTEENVRRLRANLGDPDAVVHPIGGIADAAGEEGYQGFVQAAAEAGAVGLSIYDFDTTGSQGWEVLAEAGLR